MRFWVLFLAILAIAGCRETRQTQPSHEVVAAREHVPDSATAIDFAAQAVESSRLLSSPTEPLPAPVFVRGMALPLYNEFPGLRFEEMLDRIASTGATYVSVVVSWNQRTIFENRIRPSASETPDDKRVREIIAAAKERGLDTMLFPIIHVDIRGDGEWRGKMKPADIDRWKAEYETFILHYANLAEDTGTSMFSVGSELSSMEGHEEFWKALIGKVRGVYGGKLIYSANWDHFRVPRFWSDLDYIGVSSYFEVARSMHEPEHVVTARWATHRSELLGFSRQWKKPLILTEVGYPSVESAALKPWDYTADENGPDTLAQLAAFRSLVDAWSQPGDEFAGLFLWHGWGPGGADDTSYSIFDKPAEKLVKDWYAPVQARPKN